MSNKTSDNSVANIEENIKTIKNLLQMLENGFLTEEMCPIRSWDPTPKYASALKYILAEREQDKKRIQELEEQLRKYYNGELYTAKQLKNLENNQKKYFINKQAIIDELKRLSDMLNKTTEGRIQKYTVNEIIIRSNTLQELLEGEK